MNGLVIVLCLAPFLIGVYGDPIRTRSALGTCPAKDGELPVYLPDSDNCQIFYECSNGKPVQKECLPGLCFDTNLNVCAFPILDQSLESHVRSVVGSCPPRDTNETIYLPDSANCSIYYVCSNGSPIEKSCPPEMSFNPELDICDWSIDVPCDNDPLEKKIAPLSAVGTCPPRDTNETVFLQDDKNCSTYYICSNGRPIQAFCPPDMSFNPVLNICDWEVDVKCEQRKINEKEPRSVVGTCPEIDPPTPIYLPDNASCKIYYECSGGKPIENECPGDLEFNPTLGVCDFPLDAGCKAGNPDAPTTANPPASSSSSSVIDFVDTKTVRKPTATCPPVDAPGKPTYIPDDEDCGIFYECHGGYMNSFQCPPHTIFVPNNDICAWGNRDTCTLYTGPLAIGNIPFKD